MRGQVLFFGRVSIFRPIMRTRGPEKGRRQGALFNVAGGVPLRSAYGLPPTNVADDDGCARCRKGQPGCATYARGSASDQHRATATINHELVHYDPENNKVGWIERSEIHQCRFNLPCPLRRVALRLNPPYKLPFLSALIAIGAPTLLQRTTHWPSRLAGLHAHRHFGP